MAFMYGLPGVAVPGPDIPMALALEITGSTPSNDAHITLPLVYSEIASGDSAAETRDTYGTVWV